MTNFNPNQPQYFNASEFDFDDLFEQADGLGGDELEGDELESNLETAEFEENSEFAEFDDLEDLDSDWEDIC